MVSDRMRQRLDAIKNTKVTLPQKLKDRPRTDRFKPPPDKSLPPDVILLGNEDTGRMPVPFDTEDDCPMPVKEKIKVQGLTPAEEFQIMVPGQTVLDYYNAKVMLMVGKCEDIPNEKKPGVFKVVTEDIRGVPLEEKIADAAAMLGIYAGGHPSIVIVSEQESRQLPDLKRLPEGEDSTTESELGELIAGEKMERLSHIEELRKEVLRRVDALKNRDQDCSPKTK